jgi:NAD(P)-dependent dehydrogenase (short-subunit alcohol dehydrogenase family)
VSGVIVTGGSGGVGRAVVRAFAAKGHKVLFCYARDVVGAAETMAESPSAIGVRLDLRDPDAADLLTAEATERMGTVGVLINCAGIYPHASFTEVPAREVEEVVRVNFLAPFALMQRLAPVMAASDGGAIVNITSINAFSPEAGLAAYDASKAALAQLTKTAALELGPRNIRVNAIAPGLIAAPELQTVAPERVSAFLAHAPLGSLVDPDDIAHAACFLASAESSAITGQTLVVDCGVSLSGYMAAN